MLRHLFRSKNTVFRPNEATYSLHREPIYTKNIGQGDSTCSTKNMLLGWELDTKEHHLRITPNREITVRAALDATHNAKHQVSLHK